jgi:hypothetical protein
VLSHLGLVTAYGHVSARAGAAMLITPAADLATVTESAIVEVPLAASALPAAAPAEGWAHLALYRARPDAAAIARAQPPSAFAAAATATSLTPHGQAAWLGESIPVHDSAMLLRSADLAERAAAASRSAKRCCCAETALSPSARHQDRRGPDVAAGRRVRRLACRTSGRPSQAAHRSGDRLVAGCLRRTAAAAMAAPAPPC